ncbi:unnamed protein product, partial [Didymodactylos carnosus]
SPRVMLYTTATKIIADIHRKVSMKCRACGLPLPNFTWLRNNVLVYESNVIVKREIVDDLCLETTLEILDLNGDQYGHYECRADNILGHSGAFIDIEQGPIVIKKHRTASHQYNSRKDEMNRNERTAHALQLLKPRNKSKNKTNSNER